MRPSDRPEPSNTSGSNQSGVDFSKGLFMRLQQQLNSSLTGSRQGVNPSAETSSSRQMWEESSFMQSQSGIGSESRRLAQTRPKNLHLTIGDKELKIDLIYISSDKPILAAPIRKTLNRFLSKCSEDLIQRAREIANTQNPEELKNDIEDFQRGVSVFLEDIRAARSDLQTSMSPQYQLSMDTKSKILDKLNEKETELKDILQAQQSLLRELQNQIFPQRLRHINPNLLNDLSECLSGLNKDLVHDQDKMLHTLADKAYIQLAKYRYSGDNKKMALTAIIYITKFLEINKSRGEASQVLENIISHMTYDKGKGRFPENDGHFDRQREISYQNGIIDATREFGTNNMATAIRRVGDIILGENHKTWLGNQKEKVEKLEQWRTHFRTLKDISFSNSQHITDDERQKLSRAIQGIKEGFNDFYDFYSSLTALINFKSKFETVIY